MENYGQCMFSDITSQPETLQAVFDGFINQAIPLNRVTLQSWLKEDIVFTGCGTTYALSLSVSALFKQLGFSSSALPASEISFYPETIPPGAPTLVAFSRSGETSETVWAVNSFHQQRPGAKVIVITASPNSTLAQSADLVLSAISARDSSVIETKSYTSMLMLAQTFSVWLVNQQLRLDLLASVPRHMKTLMPKLKATAECFGRDESLTRFFFLGSGLLYGVACQAAFTMKESTADWAEGFHPMEFRHGPRTAAVKGAFVVLFLPDQIHVVDEEQRVLREMKDQGARTLAILDKKVGAYASLSSDEDVLELGSGLGDSDRMVLYLPFVQWLAYFRALSKDQDPDHPANLNAVTRL